MVLIYSYIFLRFSLDKAGRFGRKKDGLLQKIHWAGFNGIVGILWVDGFRILTKFRLVDGDLLVLDLRLPLCLTVHRKILVVDLNKDRLCCSGHMIHFFSFSDNT